MSSNCCDNSQMPFDGLSPAYMRVLWAVIAINGVMFLVEMGAGVHAGSQALQADALDFLGDTATYALSLWVIGRPLRWRSRAALLKGLTLAVMAIWVLGSTAYRVLVLGMPSAFVMGTVGTLALVANVVAALLLYRFRDGDANVRSVWLCSRNDAIGNIAVVVAAVAVYMSRSPWPDLVVAMVMAGLFLASAVRIVSQARDELRTVPANVAASGRG